ncbi:hypothetical protein DFQ27_008959 [Actinomortierella ambigua]|uniref:Uncharacterized protein n=1 Tax=Actinomortierella ambigua TaxID=1343610 RepID=A0A9P6TY99_9FUNG|nr:hypothetical protein DFQ27_008959 [Actinomortierella ambigua]
MNPDAAGRQGSKKGGGSELPLTDEEGSSSTIMNTWSITVSDDIKAVIKEEAQLALQAASPAYTRELLATEVANHITQQLANKHLDMLKDDPIITDTVEEIAIFREEVGEQRAQLAELVKVLDEIDNPK